MRIARLIVYFTCLAMVVLVGFLPFRYFNLFHYRAYWLGAFTFVALFPHMLNIIRLLKPESVIKRLKIEITNKKT
jgi:hypothetical protein